MLNILLLSPQGEGYGLAHRLKQEGHIVKFWRELPHQTLDVIQGVDRYEEHIEAADLIIDVTSRYGGVCQELRTRGKVVIGGTVQELLTYDEEYAKEALTHILNVELNPGYEGSQYVSFNGLFNGQGWVDLWTSQNFYRLLDGDRGPILGSMASVIWREDNILRDLDLLLSKVQCPGYFSLHAMVCPQGIFAYTFDCSLDSLSFLAFAERFGNQIGNSLYSLAEGKVPINIMDKGISVAVRLLSMSQDANIEVIPQAEKHYFHSLLDLGTCTASGEDVREARRRVYRTINNIANQDVVYRSDIGQKGEVLCL